MPFFALFMWTLRGRSSGWRCRRCFRRLGSSADLRYWVVRDLADAIHAAAAETLTRVIGAVTTVRAAAVQLSPVLDSRDGTVERVVAKIDELATRGVQFATFPETVVPYYPYFSFVQPPYQMLAEQTRLMGQAITVPSPATQAIGDAAGRAGMVVSIGVNERDGGFTVQHPTAFRCRRNDDPASPQDHPHLSRAHHLGPGRWQRTSRGGTARWVESASWPVGSITTRSRATR